MKRNYSIIVLFLGIILTFSQFGYAQTIQIMPLGDSITEGVRGSDPVGGFRDDLDSLLTDAGISFNFVGDSVDGDPSRFDVDHQGIPGWRADQIDANVTGWLNAYQPEMVLLHIGTNDISNGDENNQTIAEIESILNKINAYNANTPILFCSLIPRNDDQNVKNDNLNILIKDLFYAKKEAGYNIYYVGQNEVFKTDPNWATDYISDTVHPNNTGYAIMAKVYFNAILNVMNGTMPYVTDNFNRTKFGETWSAEASMQISNNRITNTNPNHIDASDWDLAVYKAQVNPTEVSFTWGPNANTAGIQEGGFAVKLDRVSPINQVNGYLVWINANNDINLWRITNGIPDNSIGGVDSAPSLLPFPSAGDRMKLKIRGHHFSVFVNGDSAGTVSDPNPTLNPVTQYAGVLLMGGSSLDNDVDDFDLYQESDTVPPGDIVDFHVVQVTTSSVTLEWTAPGDDGDVGQASLYDLRYSLNPIDINNFDQATRATDVNSPALAGTKESYNLTALDKNTIYYFALKAFDEVMNSSNMATTTARTLDGNEIVDNFNRADLGANWTAKKSYKIDQTLFELDNTSSEENWDYLAVYNAVNNPVEVSFQWGAGANAQGIENGGIAMMLDKADTTANGYLLWIRPESNLLMFYSLINGTTAQGTKIADMPYDDTVLPDPKAGDIFKVIASADDNANYFDLYVDGTFYGRFTDNQKLHGNSENLFAGVMLHGNRSNNIDNFTIVASQPSAIQIVKGDQQSGTVNTQLPDTLIAKIVDSNNRPVANVAAQFNVIQGDGQVLNLSTSGIKAEAEDGEIELPFKIGTDNNASNSKYVYASTDEKSGLVKINFYVPQNGTYYFWGRTYALSGTEDSFYARVDSDAEFTWFLNSGGYNQWNWLKLINSGNVVSKYLTKGVHSISLRQREVNSRIDKILVTDDPNYTPIAADNNPGQLTDAKGEVKAFYQLGKTAGDHIIEVSSSVVDGVTANFTETGVADSPATISKYSGDEQNGKAETALDSPLVVLVTDQYNNPVEGAAVTFEVVSGGGALGVTDPVLTNANGLASNTLTLGMEFTNTVRATSPGTQPTEVVFTEYASEGIPSAIQYVSGNSQEGPAGSQLAAPFVVKVVDGVGNGIPDQTVTWSVTKGNGVPSATSTITGADGTTQITFQIGTETDTNLVEATSNGFTPVVFTATANAGIAKNIAKVSGDSQSGTVGKQLAQPLKVKVTDAQGTGMANYDVTFAVTDGGGSIVETQPVKTGADGIAQVHWKLGNVAGVNKAQAQANGLNGSPINFSATGNADVPANLTKVSGDSASGKVSQQLPNPFVVKVTDQYNNPVKNTAVLFTVTEGGGKFLNNQVTQTVNTDSSGQATVFLVLGPIAGTYNNKVKTEKSGVSGSPIYFVASAEPSDAAKIVENSGNNQTGFVRQALPQPFVVKVMDASSNVVEGHPVKFTVKAGGGTLNGDSQTTVTIATNAQGLASVTFWPGATAGDKTNEVWAEASNGQNPLTNSPVKFYASAKYTATKIQLVDGNNQSGVVASMLPKPLKVKVLDGSNQPVANIPVTFEVKSGGGTLDGNDKTSVIKQTDSQGVASVTLKLGAVVGQDNNVVHASADDGFDPLSGSPVIFKASATSSNAVKIQIAGGNNQTGTAGQALPNKLQISVLDSLNNPVPGHPVVFKIKKGQGHFPDGDTVKTVNSNANGLAEITWFLGNIAGTNNNQVQVESTDGIHPLQGSPLTFTASANPGLSDPDASTVVATSPAIADGNSVSNVTVTLIDQAGNLISGKTVTIAVSGSHNFISPPAVQSGADGRAVFTLTSITAETKTITATNTTDNIQLNNTAQVVFQPGPAAKMFRSAGNEQIRNVGTVLKDPLVVRIEDNFNNPVAGVTVFFEVKDGKGGGYLVESQPVVSDTNGEAKAFYILGNDAGVNLIEARSANLQGSPVLFSETGEVNNATQLVKVSGADQKGIAGKTLANPLVVQTLDSKGDPVKNIPVTFSVTLGGGQVSQPQPVQSDAYGNASTMFTLGPGIGVHIAKAESPGLQNSPISFVANANSGEAYEVVLVSGDNQSGTVHSSGSALKVKVLDRNGNAVEGFPVIFNKINGDVTITNDQPDTSDVAGLAQATFRYGTKSGNAKIRAVAEGLVGSPIDFHLTALPDVATSATLAWGNNQRGTVEHELITPLAIRIKDQYDNNVPGYSVTWVITEGSASIVGNATVQSNNNGIASCRILLSATPGNITVLAIASGLTGSPITFNAVSVVNNFPTLSTPLKNAEIQETQTLTFNVTGSDPDGDALEFKVIGKPKGAALDSVDATTRKFQWTPDYSQAGSYTLRFELRDGNGGIDRDTVRITVLNKNRKPNITQFDPPESSFKVKTGEGRQFSLVAEDPDQEPLQYFWTKNGEKIWTGQNYTYLSKSGFTGIDYIKGWVTDGIDSVFHQWSVNVVTSVELSSFSASSAAEKLAIELNWETGKEEDNLGFNIYRGIQKDGTFKKVNEEIIAPEPSGSYTYLDTKVEAGVHYYYKLEDVSVYGIRTMHGPVLAELSLPKSFALEQNYPNPFNPETTIKFQLPKQVRVYIGIYNILGQEINTLLNREIPAGYHTIKWDGRDQNGNMVTSGIYYYRIKTDSFTALKKMVLLK